MQDNLMAKKLIAFILLVALIVLSVKSSFAQSSFEDHYDKWTFYPNSPNLTFQAKGYQRIIIEPKDTATYIYNITKTKKVWYDTTWTSQVYENTSSLITKVNTIEGLKTDVSGGNFTYVATAGTLSTMKFTFTGSEISFWGERWSGHGVVVVYVDGVNRGSFNQGIAPIVTDFNRGIPTFKMSLPKGAHTIEVQSIGQFILDFFKVTAYTTKIHI